MMDPKVWGLELEGLTLRLRFALIALKAAEIFPQRDCSSEKCI